MIQSVAHLTNVQRFPRFDFMAISDFLLYFNIWEVVMLRIYLYIYTGSSPSSGEVVRVPLLTHRGMPAGVPIIYLYRVTLQYMSIVIKGVFWVRGGGGGYNQVNFFVSRYKGL